MRKMSSKETVVSAVKGRADLRTVEDQLARPLKDPLAALGGGIGSQRLACQLVQGAANDSLHLTHPQLHCPCQAGVHSLYPVNLLAWMSTKIEIHW